MIKKTIPYFLGSLILVTSVTANAGFFTGVKVKSAEGADQEYVTSAIDIATTVLLVIPDRNFIEVDEDDKMNCFSEELDALLKSHDMELHMCWDVLHQFAVTYNADPVIQLFYKKQIEDGLCYPSGDGQLFCEETASHLVLRYMVFTSEHFNKLVFIEHSTPDFPLVDIDPIVELD